jgi:hypothetical protein
MDFGLGYFPTDDGIGSGPLARLLEERGQDAVFFAEHTHIPASRETPYPEGGELPVKYWHCYDQFVALMAAAAATTKLRVGTGVCLVVERDPSSRPRKWPAWTIVPAGDSSSVSVPAGTVKRCATTVPTHASGWRCCGSGSRR